MRPATEAGADGWPLKDAAMVLAVALLVRLAWWYMAGTRISPDGHGYLSMCGPFWHPSGWLSGAVRVDYAGFQVPLCVFLALPGTTVSQWPAVQIVAGSATAVLVYDVARRRFGRRAGLVAGLGFGALWETAQWDVYVLSETTFMLALAVVLWSLVRFLDVPDGRGRRATLWVALVWLAFTRPVGAPVVAALLAWDFFPRSSRWRIGLTGRAGVVAVWLAVVALAIVAGDRTAWADSALYPVWANGLLVHDDPTYSIRYPARPADSLFGFALRNVGWLALLGVLKVLVFFLPFADRFSALHVLTNAVTLVPVMLAAILGILRLARVRPAELRLWLTPLCAMLALVAVTFVDYDWRYRAPATLLLAILAGAAFADDSGATRWLKAPLVHVRRWRANRVR